MTRSEQKTVLEAFRKTIGQELHNLGDWPEILWQQMFNRLQWMYGSEEESPIDFRLCCGDAGGNLYIMHLYGLNGKKDKVIPAIDPGY